MTPDELNEVEARADCADVTDLVALVRELQSMVSPLTHDAWVERTTRAEKAEARVKELEAELNKWHERCDQALVERNVNQQRGQEICCAYGSLLMQVGALFPAIAHGDDAHRAWLKAAIDKHFDMDAHNRAATALTERLKCATALVAALGRQHPYNEDLHQDVVAALDAYLKAAP